MKKTLLLLLLLSTTILAGCGEKKELPTESTSTWKVSIQSTTWDKRDDFYLEAKVKNQPFMGSKSWAENNINMHKYLDKEQYSFEVPKTDKVVYIHFVTTKPIASNRNIFIAVNGKTLGRIDKSKALTLGRTERDNMGNWYSYKLDKIPLIQNGLREVTLNLQDWPNSTIHINGVVGEADNKLERIFIINQE